MRHACVAVVALFVLSAVAADRALAAETQASQYIAPSVKVDGSLGWQWSDNVNQSGTTRTSDNFVSSFLKVTLQGKTSDGTGYYLYARAFNEFYDRTSSDNTLGTVGATLARSFDQFDAGINLDGKKYYDRFFGSELRTAFDLSVYATRVFRFDNGLSAVVPRFTVGNRWADASSAERTWIDAQLALEAHVAEQRWYVVSISRLQVHWYHTAATGAVPQDFVPAQSLGVKYRFNDDISLTVSAAVTGRSSNVGARNFSQWSLGPMLEFSHKF